MKLGVLICDPVSKKLRHISGDYREMFSVLFKSFENHVKLKFYNVFSGDYPTEIDECDAYISSGAAASVYDDEQWVRVFEDYIRLLYKERVRFVGICFGHQMTMTAMATLNETDSVLSSQRVISMP
ncbi:MAG: hypothetical protein HRT88_00505 [Lentisphaeraceae bacterium]|nr:hypothetical protein [Lentisphaeraceae bacterium]